MDITRRKPVSAAGRQTLEMTPGLTWSQVALKSRSSQTGIPLPCSVQHRLWIQPGRHCR